jgi:hypothetical protein
VQVSTQTASAKKWGRIPEAEEFSGFRRGHLYKMARAHPGLFRKVGTKTVVDLEMLGAILENAPPAELSPSNTS